MKTQVAQHLISKLSHHHTRVTFSGLGNPLCHPQWDQWGQTFAQNGEQWGLVVHASQLTVDTRRRLVAAGPSFLEISFPSCHPAAFAHLCPRADYDLSLQQLLALRDDQKRRFPMVINALTTGHNPKEAQHSAAFWQEKQLLVRTFPCHSRAGALSASDLLLSESAPETTAERGAGHPVEMSVQGACGLFATHAFIACTGDLLACCHDLTGESVIGHIQRDPLEELMLRKAAIVEQAQQRGEMPFAMCRRCDEARRSQPMPTRPFPRTARQRKRARRAIYV